MGAGFGISASTPSALENRFRQANRRRVSATDMLPDPWVAISPVSSSARRSGVQYSTSMPTSMVSEASSCREESGEAGAHINGQQILNQKKKTGN